MAWSSSSMALQLHPHCRASLFTFDLPSNPRAQQQNQSLLLGQHGALLPPVKKALHFRCKRIQSLSLRASSPYKSAFTPSTLLRLRSPCVRRMFTSDKWHMPIVRSGQSFDEGKGAGVAGKSDIFFSATDSEIEGEEAADNSGVLEGPAYLTVEEIEVDGSESGPPELLLNEIAEADMVVEGSGSPHDIFSSVSRPLGGVPKEEESSFQNSTTRKNIKLWRNPLRLLDGSTPLATDPLRRKIADGFRRARDDFFDFSSQLSKYIFIMTATGAILATGFQLSGGESHQEGVLWFSWLAGVIIGSMIGAGQVLESHAKRGRRNVVITGSTRGLGKALAREFLRAGDNVVIASRSPESVRGTVLELQKEVQEKYRVSLLGGDSHVETFEGTADKIGSKVVGMACDVSNSEDVQALADMALAELGNIDIWINNAGMNKGFRPLVEFSDEEISEIVSTNLTGSLICTREAIRVMKKQPKGGHIFNMDGAGSGGASTPLTAVYGATKCGLRQLSASLLQECKGSRVGIHTASPGMVLTDLLLSGASLQNKKMFNIICEQPETVAQALVPNLRTVKGTGKAVEYLTPPRIVLAILNAWFRRGRWFDEEGRAVYAAEAERLRLWAEGREKSPVTVAMEMVPSGAWVSLFSSSVLCAYVILSNISGGGSPGT